MAGEIEEPFRFDFQVDLLNSGSISFGRFESESLSWERRSSFSHNRYLEEVEKYSKPGSVTEKKAYFEAHFRRKALLKQSSSESQDGKESPMSEQNDLQDLQESENCNESRQFPFFNEISDEETKIQKSVNKNFESLYENETHNDMVIMVDVASEANNLSLTSHTADKDKDDDMVKPTSETKQSKLKAHANDPQVQKIISSEASVKAKTRESKSLQMKEKEKKAPRPATPIAYSGRKTFKSEESSRSFSKAKILPLNKSFVKEYKSVRTTETKSLVLEKSLPGERQTANRNKQTTTTTPPSVNKGSTGFTFRSDQRAERRKEEKRAAEMAQSRKSHNFKATPMPSFYKESTRCSAQKAQLIRPSSSPSLTNKNPLTKTYVNEKKKKELTFQQKETKPTKGPRVLRKDVKRVDLVNGTKPDYLAVGVAI